MHSTEIGDFLIHYQLPIIILISINVIIVVLSMIIKKGDSHKNPDAATLSQQSFSKKIKNLTMLSSEEKRQHAFVIRELTGREIKRKYSRSKLGIVWSVLNPLLTMAVLSMVFSKMFARSIENFPVYYLCGFVIWSFFVNATNSAMTALVDNRMLLIKVKMPMDVFLLSRVYTAFVNFMYSLIAFVAMLAFFKVALTWRIVLFPIIVALTALFSLGLSYFLACAYTFFGDIKHLWGVLTTLWMYLSAIFYPVDVLPDYLQKLIGFNPIFLFIDATRRVVLWGTLPTASEWIRMLIFAGLAFIIGKKFFDNRKNTIMQKL